MFFGTTNETQFLRDTTGNRRFWVAETPNAQPRKLLPSLAALDSETVRRIWGEAVTMYKAGEKLYLTPELETVASEIRESFEKENPKVGIIGEYLDRLLPPGWEDMDTYTRRQWLETNAVGTVQRRTVCAFEIWAGVCAEIPTASTDMPSKKYTISWPNFRAGSPAAASRKRSNPTADNVFIYERMSE